ncbi:hypothetical protein [Streptomyces sp. OE57]|uniref:hypothetical protein n=1 Tax=Streptomyces lacaronensis TaxID=3379885 RepID=UPI0039B779DF
MAQFGCGGSRCTCQVVAGPGVTVTGNGSNGAPYVISTGGTVTCDQVRPCISAGPGASYNPATGVIEARPSTDAGNTLEIGTDGGLLVPGPAPLETGCGLTGDGTAGAPLTAAVAAWPYACDVSNGSGIYCDPATGQLRGDPKPYSSSNSQFFTQTFSPPLAGPTAPNEVIATFCATFTNPDPCRPATLLLAREVDITVDLGPGAAIETGQTGDNMTRIRNLSNQTYQGWHDQTTKVLGGGIVAPGADIQVCFDATAGRSEGTTNITGVQAILRAFFFTA